MSTERELFYDAMREYKERQVIRLSYSHSRPDCQGRRFYFFFNEQNLRL